MMAPGYLFCFASVLWLQARGHVLPRETTTLQPEPLNAVPWPLNSAPEPTPAPRTAGMENVDVQEPLNTICGYIGGDASLPATCVAGSHCAVDVEHGAVGCCPNGDECVRGIFTSCVDKNSGPQTVADPYIFTCAGDNVCYKNTFDGGFFQYGCGSASNLATHVATTADGAPPLQLSHKTLALTATPTQLVPPESMASFISSPTSHTMTGSDPERSSDVENGSAPRKDKHSLNTGAIVGGTIGGVAFVALLVALVFLLLRRRRGDARKKAGSRQGFIGAMSEGQRNFIPLSSSQQALAGNGAARSALGGGDATAHGNTLVVSSSRQPEAPQRPGALAGNNTTRGSGDDADQVPLTREMDDTSNGYHSALESNREDDSVSQPSSSNVPYPGPRRYGGSALWQQNRRSTRNLKWL